MKAIIHVVAAALLLAACATEETAKIDTSDSPELTAEEIAQLPAANDPDHDEALLVDGVIGDDASTFDDDEALLVYDVDVDEIAFQPLLHSGLHPRASDALRAAGVTAGRITQTIGN